MFDICWRLVHLVLALIFGAWVWFFLKYGWHRKNYVLHIKWYHLLERNSYKPNDRNSTDISNINQQIIRNIYKCLQIHKNPFYFLPILTSFLLNSVKFLLILTNSFNFITNFYQILANSCKFLQIVAISYIFL